MGRKHKYVCHYHIHQFTHIRLDCITLGASADRENKKIPPQVYDIRRLKKWGGFSRRKNRRLSADDRTGDWS